MHFRRWQIFTAVFRFALVSLLAVVLLGVITFAVSHGLAWFNNVPWDRPAFLIIGLVCGLIIWLFIAIFHLRHETIILPAPERSLFLAEAKRVLQEMGYTIGTQRANDIFFRPRFNSYLFGGGIHVFFRGTSARMLGPKVSLEIFRGRYRLEHHVERVHKVFRDQRRFTDNTLKRVELRLRLRADQFAAVAQNVVSLLEEDSEVICEINVLAQSAHGIPENLVEFQIREWLKQQDISCDIHKDRVQFVEVIHRESQALSV